jgi:hypothetical protein
VYLSQSGGDGNTHRTQSELAKCTETLTSDSESKAIGVFYSSEASACEVNQAWPLNAVTYEKGISPEKGILSFIYAHDRGKKLAFLLPFSPYGISSVHLRSTGRYTIIWS